MCKILHEKVGKIGRSNGGAGMKLQEGWTVYYIVEAFEPSYHYRIARCKVKSVPHGSLKEYCLLEKGHMYWCKRNDIYTSYEEAVLEAEKQTDIKENNALGKLLNLKLLRPWREKDGNTGNTKQDL